MRINELDLKNILVGKDCPTCTNKMKERDMN
jgi:hypothetical protein